MIGHTGLSGAGSTIIGAAGGAAGTSIGVFAPIVFGAAAGPIGIAVGAVIAAGAAIVSALGIGSGCGPTCVQATQVVNQAEPTFQANLDAYENGVIDQSTAQANYNNMWAAIKQACSGIPGAAGTNCVGDREQGACKWKQTGQPQYPGQPAYGDCWNWYEAYYRPLTLAPVNAPVSSTSTIVGDLTSSLTSSPLLLVAVAGIVGLMIAEG